MKILQLIKNNIPNSITCLNLVSGVMACIFALNAKEMYGSIYGYQMAFIMIAAAAVFDFLDGMVARLLHAVSAIGKELDSLCDSVSFGVAPAFLVYSLMDTLYPGSWIKYLAILIAVCGVLRLARFNVDTTQSTSFLGMPIPANAIFWIGFCAAKFDGTVMPEWAAVFYIVVISLLMVCNLRMFSFKFKNFAFRSNWHRYLLIVCAIAAIAINGIPGMATAIKCYILLAIFTHSMTKREALAEQH